MLENVTWRIGLSSKRLPIQDVSRRLDLGKRRVGYGEAQFYPPNEQQRCLALSFVRFPPCGQVIFVHGDWHDRIVANFPAALHAEQRNAVFKVAVGKAQSMPQRMSRSLARSKAWLLALQHLRDTLAKADCWE